METKVIAKNFYDISVTIIVKNAEKTLYNTLNSLKEFVDVVVYDNGSSDNSIEIAKSFKNVNLIQGEFKGFGWSKNKAAQYAKNDWILSLDADEVISSLLLESISKIALDEQFVYEIRRTNYYKNNKIKYCGWNEEKILRLYNKNITAYNDKFVHESIMIKECKRYALEGELKHYPYFSISDFIKKADYYSTLFAKNNVGKKKSSPAKAFFNGMYSFFRTYVLKRGFLDGYVGLIIAFSHMVTNFYKYIKLYEANKELKK